MMHQGGRIRRARRVMILVRAEGVDMTAGETTASRAGEQ